MKVAVSVWTVDGSRAASLLVHTPVDASAGKPGARWDHY
jgi:hypothetical protein